MSNPVTNDPKKLVTMLRDLYLGMEKNGQTNETDYGLARGYEDQLGSGQSFPDTTIEGAKALLRRHGFN